MRKKHVKDKNGKRTGPRGLLVLSILVLSSQAAAFDVRIRWEAVTQNTNDQAVAISHYVLYYGNISRGVVAHPAEAPLSYDHTTNVSNATEISVQGLDDAKTYFFAVAAVDQDGAYSNFSGEAVVTKDGVQNPADQVDPISTNGKEGSGGCGCGAADGGGSAALLLLGLFWLRKRCHGGKHQV